MIRIHNSLTGQKQELQPVEPGHVRMYSCGITVYDYFHVGNARMLVVFDMVSRYLRHRGYRVTYVRNITDVDDKIINRAREAGVDWREHAKKFAAASSHTYGFNSTLSTNNSLNVRSRSESAGKRGRESSARLIPGCCGTSLLPLPLRPDSRLPTPSPFG